MANSSINTALGIPVNAELQGGKYSTGIAIQPATSGGYKTFHRLLTNSINAVAIKTAPGHLYSVWAGNITAGATPFYAKFFDQITAPNPATDGANFKFALMFQADGPDQYKFDGGIEFTTGIAMVVVLGVADNNATVIAVANDGFVDGAYF